VGVLKNINGAERRIFNLGLSVLESLRGVGAILGGGKRDRGAGNVDRVLFLSILPGNRSLKLGRASRPRERELRNGRQESNSWTKEEGRPSAEMPPYFQFSQPFENKEGPNVKEGKEGVSERNREGSEKNAQNHHRNVLSV